MNIWFDWDDNMLPNEGSRVFISIGGIGKQGITQSTSFTYSKGKLYPDCGDDSLAVDDYFYDHINGWCYVPIRYENNE